ncbi:MAG: flavin-containing monooxygenase [Acidimicrobiales bacterium]
MKSHFRVVVVGSGFSGLGTAIRLKKSGMEDFIVLERAGDLGGTWRDNSYPGCACDVPSRLYSFSFAQNPEWSESFSPQAEIWAYLRRCAEDFGVLAHLRFGHEVTAMRWDDDEMRWHIETTAGQITAEVVVAGVGALSEPSIPSLPGLEGFEGTVFHSARWDHDHDLTGERVAVLGTGASAIQFVPQIQPQVAALTLFQRTPPWVMPRRNRVFGRVERWAYRRLPFTRLVARAAIYWGHECFVLGFTRNRRLMRLGRRAAIAQLRRQVPDPGLRSTLTADYTLGCKRVLLSDDYYPSLCQPNVAVVTEAISEVRPHGVVTADGVEHEVDTIIFGTGFKVTDFPAASHIWGRQGVLLEDAWSTGMEAYLGTTVAGFPNLFFMTGPNTGLGHSSMVFMIESQIAYVLDALRRMADGGIGTLEVRPEAQARFNAELVERLQGTVWNGGGCRSWYLDSRGRNTTLWPGFTFEFRRRTRRFDEAQYVARRAPAAVPEPAPEPVASMS